MKIIVCDKYISGNIEKDKKLKHRMQFLWLTPTKGELYIIMVVLLINKCINIIYPGRYFNPMKHIIMFCISFGAPLSSQHLLIN